MKGHLMKYTLIVLLSFMGLTSCDNNGSEQDSSKNVEQQVTTVSVLCQQRNAASGIDLDEDNNDDDTAPIIIDSFEEGSKLYFSQMGPNESQAPNFTYLSEDASPYLYIYEYKENKNADWSKEYNFSFQEGRKPLDWATVKNVGSVGNVFSMYAMYFPIDNEVRFKVEENQYDKKNFMKSDIMGAYHATSSLYTRLRFRLFHLMVYLKVTLYVPVYAGDDTDGDMKYSGFDSNALQEASVINACRGFTIDWRASRSSDTEAPLTQADQQQKENIIMYRHPYNPDYTTMIDVSQYYNQDVPGVCECEQDCSSESCKKKQENPSGKCGCDKVRVYNFSVLFPAQNFSGNFLCFTLTAHDNQKKYYYFSTSQIMGDSGNFSLTQGTLQQLHLYLPRKTNETILIGANILPWSDAVTDMTVTKEDKNENKDNPDD